MDRTVREHITTLEQRLNALNTKLMEEDEVEERNQLQAEIRAVESALMLYRSALEVEQRLSQV